MTEVERLALGGVGRDVAHGKLLKAAFEHELEQGRRADSAGSTDHAQLHPQSPRRTALIILAGATRERGRMPGLLVQLDGIDRL